MNYPPALMIYLDHNATTPLDDRVLEVMMPYMRAHYGNPSSLYKTGRIARAAIDNAREQVAALVGAHPSQVTFTSGGTESNNLALKGATAGRPAGAIAIGATEHPSVTKPAMALAGMGWEITTLPVDSDGLVDVTELTAAAPERLYLVSLMLANNETGVINNIPKLTATFKSQEIIIHTDAVQAAGKIPVDFSALGVHLLSLSAHKLYGPKGIGALIVDNSVKIEPQMIGGVQERGLRAGTENVAAIAGFGKAAEIATTELDKRQKQLVSLRIILEDELEKMPNVTVFGKNAERLPNTLQIGIENFDGEMMLMELDRNNIAISSGSACSSGARESSPVLVAMGVDEDLARSAIRISLGIDNSEADIKKFLLVLKDLTNVSHN